MDRAADQLLVLSAIVGGSRGDSGEGGGDFNAVLPSLRVHSLDRRRSYRPSPFSPFPPTPREEREGAISSWLGGARQSLRGKSRRMQSELYFENANLGRVNA